MTRASRSGVPGGIPDQMDHDPLKHGGRRRRALKGLKPCRLVLALFLLAGCGEKTRPGEEAPPSGQAPRGAPTRITDRAGTGVQDGQAQTVTVRVVDEDSGKPVPGVGVRLFFNPLKKPSRVRHLDAKANLDGEAVFELGQPIRLMTRCEYSLENTEFSPDPDGETECVLKVRTQHEVKGRVVGPDGEGIAGASVFLAPLSPGLGAADWSMPIPGAGCSVEAFRRRFGYDLEGEAVTGEGGRFTASVKTCQTLLATAHAEDFISADWRFIAFAAREGGYAPSEIPLYPAARLHATLYDTRERTLPDKMISLIETDRSLFRRKAAAGIFKRFAVAVHSGPDGRAEIPVPSGVELTVENRFLFPEPGAEAPFPDPVRDVPLDAVRLAPGETGRVAVIPPRSVRLECVVLDEGGAPLPGARMTLPVATFETNEEGAFNILVPYNLHRRMGFEVAMTGYRTFNGILPEIGPDTMTLPLEVSMERAVELAIAAHPSLTAIWLQREDGDRGRTYHSLSGGELLPPVGELLKGRRNRSGEFVFPGIDPGSYTVLAQQGTFRFTILKGIAVEAGEGHRQQLDLTARTAPSPAPEAARIIGQVVMPEGTKPHGMQVIVMRNDLPGVRRFDPFAIGKEQMGWTTARVDLDGHFEIDGLAPGRYALAATMVEWDTRIDAYQEVQVAEGDHQAVLEVAGPESYGSAMLKLTNTRSDPMAGIQLFLLDPVDAPLGRAGRSDFFSVSDREGEILLDRLPPGRYGISLSDPEGAGYLLDFRVEVRPKTRTTVSVVLP